MKKKLMAIAAASALVLAACGGDDEATEDTAAEVTEDTMAEDAMEVGDIVAVASANADFSTLVAAIQAAGLVETLQGAGPFTVFAPTSILTYHVVPGLVMSTDVAAGDVATVEGSNVTLATEGGVKINDANVMAVDVAASNGVIHVIDAVIVPPTVDLSSL